MVFFLIQNGLIKTTPITLQTNPKKPIIYFQSKTQKFLTPYNFINKLIKPNSKNHLNSTNEPSKLILSNKKSKKIGDELIIEVNSDKNNDENKRKSKKKMVYLSGVGYFVQGFRCFPWLALNFHMANNLKFDPSTLQLVQYSANLPMVAKPLYGVLCDAIHIGGSHRIPYICIGVLLQVLSWGPLAVIPFVGELLPTLMACVLLSNLGAAITEVVQDALVAEYGQKHKIVGLQSYTFMAIAFAGILGNLVGGVLLSRTHPRVVLFLFSILLLLQLIFTSFTKEDPPARDLVDQGSILSSIKRRFSELLTALSGERIRQPLIWAVVSIAMVPMLNGSIFCYQTQFLKLDPSTIGLSKVIGQVLLLSLTLLYDRFWKTMPFRKLMTRVQMLYAASLLLDLVLVTQTNLKIGIPNDVFALCFCGLAETAAVFKTVPFLVLIGSLCPPGCEATVNAFLASALTLSSIASGFFGIGLASLLGITSTNYSNLPVGIVLQCFAALLPLFWINTLPVAVPSFEKDRSKVGSRRNRKNRRLRSGDIQVIQNLK